KINNVCLSNYSNVVICNKIHIACGIEVVAGTVLYNLCENDFSQEKLKYLSELLDDFGVSFLEKYFEKKIDSQTIKYYLEFDTMVVLKMNLI
ncbi:antibiotic ABC transporter, partial [Francisella tularensis subsp. holarctica]|nr:antibiotic ABC transporter [Francisella tularensis subsp. holarctica]